MKEIISKELLSKILDKTVVKVYDDTNWIRHNIRSDVKDDDILVLYKDKSSELISTHTVAHKCKDYIVGEGYTLELYEDSQIFNVEILNYDCETCFMREIDREKWFDLIIKATQWVSDNKE